MQTKVKIEKVGDSLADWHDVIKRSPNVDTPNARLLLMQLVATSEIAYVGKYEGKIACVFGLVPPTLLSDAAFLWLLPTDLVAEHQFLFVRYSQLIMEKMLERYPTIIGTTEYTNRSAIRWIKWLGGQYSAIPDRNGMLSFVIRRGDE